jgi:hypothetical protein
MEFNARYPQLEDTDRNRRTKQVLPDNGLALEQGVLNMVPELNDEGDIPPEARAANKAGA